LNIFNIFISKQVSQQPVIAHLVNNLFQIDSVYIELKLKYK